MIWNVCTKYKVHIAKENERKILIRCPYFSECCAYLADTRVRVYLQCKFTFLISTFVTEVILIEVNLSEMKSLFELLRV